MEQMVEQWQRERPDVDPSSMAVFARLTRAHLAATRAIEATLGRHGLNRGEFDLLASLRRSSSPYRLSPGDLARAMVLSPAATTNRLQRLEERGLVIRRPDPAAFTFLAASHSFPASTQLDTKPSLLTSV